MTMKRLIVGISGASSVVYARRFLEAARQGPEVIGIETFLGRVEVRLNVSARDMAQ